MFFFKLHITILFVISFGLALVNLSASLACYWLVKTRPYVLTILPYASAWLYMFALPSLLLPGHPRAYTLQIFSWTRALDPAGNTVNTCIIIINTKINEKSKTKCMSHDKTKYVTYTEVELVTWDMVLSSTLTSAIDK